MTTLLEESVAFMNDKESIRGVLHHPDPTGPCRGGIVFLHGWAGTRHGPHRMFVAAARRFASMGFACLRFDFRGRGESDGRTRDASIRTMASDARTALSFLDSRLHPQAILLLGICSGAKVAIEAAADTGRAQGLILWSAEAMGHLRGDSARARKARHAIVLYVRKLFHADTWRKLLTGRVNTRMVGRAMLATEGANAAERKRESEILSRFRSFHHPVLFTYGTQDPEAGIAREPYRRFCEQHSIPHRLHDIDGANHSYYSMASEQEVLDLTARWIEDLDRVPRHAPAT